VFTLWKWASFLLDVSLNIYPSVYLQILSREFSFSFFREACVLPRLHIVVDNQSFVGAQLCQRQTRARWVSKREQGQAGREKARLKF
jgi:hypothetical protein